MSTTEERLAELEDRLRQMEIERDEQTRGRNPFRVLRDISHELVPSEVQRHMISARRENLLAVRAYLDRAITRLEDAATRVSPNPSTPDERL